MATRSPLDSLAAPCPYPDNKDYAPTYDDLCDFGAIQGANGEVFIDADSWAESGGTAGIYGVLHKRGRLRIIGMS